MAAVSGDLLARGFGVGGGEEGTEGGDAGFGEGAGLGKEDEGRQGFKGAGEGGEGVGEDVETGVAADFADGAEDANGSELLEEVGVAEDGGLNGGGGELGLVGADGFENGGDFGFGKADVAEDRGRLGDRVGSVVPADEEFEDLRGDGR